MLFARHDYRDAFVDLYEYAVKKHPGMSYAGLARATGINGTYISNVLKARADFSADQLFALLDEMKVDAKEKHFVLLLLEHERCHYRARKQSLAKELEKIREENLRAKHHLAAKQIQPQADEAAAYYLHPHAMILHFAIGIDRYASDVPALARELGISVERAYHHLEQLESFGYIEQRKDKSYRILREHQHLATESPFCVPHQMLMRLESLEHQLRLPDEKRKNVSVTFTADKSTKDKIQAEFLHFLKKCEGLVRAAKSEELYQMNFDLFGWLN